MIKNRPTCCSRLREQLGEQRVLPSAAFEEREAQDAEFGRDIASVDRARVELVWSPAWNLSMVTDAGKEQLCEFGVRV